MERDVFVESVAGSRFRQQITADEAIFFSDEPTDVGGGGGAPTPYDLLLGALGACTSMTLRMYSDRKGWPLDAVRVRLRHQRIHASDCDDCDNVENDAMIDVLERHIELRGDLDDAQREKLLEIANKCPVHRTLTNHIRIRTDLVAFGPVAE